MIFDAAGMLIWTMGVYRTKTMNDIVKKATMTVIKLHGKSNLVNWMRTDRDQAFFDQPKEINDTRAIIASQLAAKTTVTELESTTKSLLKGKLTSMQTQIALVGFLMVLVGRLVRLGSMSMLGMIVIGFTIAAPNKPMIAINAMAIAISGSMMQRLILIADIIARWSAVSKEIPSYKELMLALLVAHKMTYIR